MVPLVFWGSAMSRVERGERCGRGREATGSHDVAHVRGGATVAGEAHRRLNVPVRVGQGGVVGAAEGVDVEGAELVRAGLDQAARGTRDHSEGGDRRPTRARRTGTSTSGRAVRWPFLVFGRDTWASSQWTVSTWANPRHADPRFGRRPAFSRPAPSCGARRARPGTP